MRINETVVIDTNVLIYFFDETSSFYKKAREFVDDNFSDIVITSKSVSEFICALSKIEMYDIVLKELPHILADFKVIYPDRFSIDILNSLVRQYHPVGIKVFDYEIASIMLANNIQKLLTNNIDDFKKIKEIEIIPLE